MIIRRWPRFVKWLLRASLFGFTRRSVFFLLAKCVSITRNDTAEPSAVARPAPQTPISHGKTKNQSPNTLKMPPDHRHVDDAVDAGDQRAAERRRQVFEVKRFDISTQKVHCRFLLSTKKPDKEQASQPAPYPAAVSFEQRALRVSKRDYSTRKRQCQAAAISLLFPF